MPAVCGMLFFLTLRKSLLGPAPGQFLLNVDPQDVRHPSNIVSTDVQWHYVLSFPPEVSNDLLGFGGLKQQIVGPPLQSSVAPPGPCKRYHSLRKESHHPGIIRKFDDGATVVGVEQGVSTHPGGEPVLRLREVDVWAHSLHLTSTRQEAPDPHAGGMRETQINQFVHQSAGKGRSPQTAAVHRFPAATASSLDLVPGSRLVWVKGW